MRQQGQKWRIQKVVERFASMYAQNYIIICGSNLPVWKIVMFYHCIWYTGIYFVPFLYQFAFTTFWNCLLRPSEISHCYPEYVLGWHNFGSIIHVGKRDWAITERKEQMCAWGTTVALFAPSWKISCLFVCGQNHVCSVFSSVLARPLSCLHISSTNFWRCVICWML